MQSIYVPYRRSICPICFLYVLYTFSTFPVHDPFFTFPASLTISHIVSHSARPIENGDIIATGRRRPSRPFRFISRRKSTLFLGARSTCGTQERAAVSTTRSGHSFDTIPCARPIKCARIKLVIIALKRNSCAQWRVANAHRAALHRKGHVS